LKLKRAPRPVVEGSAAYCFIHVSHRETAVEHATEAKLDLFEIEEINTTVAFELAALTPVEEASLDLGKVDREYIIPADDLMARVLEEFLEDERQAPRAPF
jgi:hypothetical protein